jgi:hypothetical protein
MQHWQCTELVIAHHLLCDVWRRGIRDSVIGHESTTSLAVQFELPQNVLQLMFRVRLERRRGRRLLEIPAVRIQEIDIAAWILQRSRELTHFCSRGVTHSEDTI